MTSAIIHNAQRPSAHLRLGALKQLCPALLTLLDKKGSPIMMLWGKFGDLLALWWGAVGLDVVKTSTETNG